ncbi:MAG: IgGFc-binding protein [Polyangiales bacterium]
MRARFASFFFFSAFSLFACSKGDKDTGSQGTVDSGLGDASFDTEPVFDVALDSPPDLGPPPIVDPKTCEEAASSKSYVGCDFWPTVVANSVWDTFDFAAIVANAGKEEAKITVTGPGGFLKEAIVGPGRLVKVYLPWVKELKGPESDSCGQGRALTGTVRADKSAYHVVTTKPVTVYQFNALEYQGSGGPVGKDWSTCPGNTDCINDMGNLGPLGCYSFTNDASLLLPSTAMTGNYRITGYKSVPGISSYVVVTGVHDDTDVTVKVGPKGRIVAGGGLAYTPGNGTATFKVSQGDVVEMLVSGGNFDLSGSLIKASKAVQVITGVPCIEVPVGSPACDHIEETVLPAETLGRDYVVTLPTGPDGLTHGAVVRLIGNVDGTTLTYKPSAPPGAPTKIDAGQVVDLGVVTDDFEVIGTGEFAIATVQQGGSIVDPGELEGLQKGDPALSVIPSVEQWRTKYVFLAPDDYVVNYVDVAAKKGTKLTLDGAEVTVPSTDLDGTDYTIFRIKLDVGPSEVGAHVLDSDKPIGIQVLGYGQYTSYQYPGGLNLISISPPPVK